MPVENVYDDQALLDMIRNVARDLGRTPGKEALDARLGWYATQTVIQRFGSYSHAVELAGLVPNARKGPAWRKYNESAVRGAYARIAAVYERPPTLREWARQRLPGEPAAITLRKRFGSWPAFLAAMGDHQVDAQAS